MSQNVPRRNNNKWRENDNRLLRWNAPEGLPILRAIVNINSRKS